MLRAIAAVTLNCPDVDFLYLPRLAHYYLSTIYKNRRRGGANAQPSVLAIKPNRLVNRYGRSREPRTCPSPISVGSNNLVTNRRSFRDTFAQDRRWSVRLITRSWTVPRFRLPQSPDARIKQKMSAVGMTALSEQNGQRQITPPAVRNDDEVHQLGQS